MSKNKKNQVSETWDFTEESLAQAPAWNERWQQMILSVAPIVLPKVIQACSEMYRICTLPQPVFGHVRSPILAIILGSAGTAYWALRAAIENDKPIDVDHETLNGGELVLAVDTTPPAFDSATIPITDPEIALRAREAQSLIRRIMCTPAEVDLDANPVLAGTDEIIYVNPDVDITCVNSVVYFVAVREVAIKLGIAPAAVYKCTAWVRDNHYSSFYNGGSDWLAWVSYLSFVRDIIKWQHPSHVNYAWYEQAAIYGGPRFMHRNFVLLSDRPTDRLIDKVDEAYRLHNDTGPAIAWSCGNQDWYLDGVRVDEQIVMRPETQTLDQIRDEPNMEVRRLRIFRYGGDGSRYFSESNAILLDSRDNLIETTTESLFADGELRFLHTFCPSTGKVYFLPVAPEVMTCLEAQNWLWSDEDTSRSIVGRT